MEDNNCGVCIEKFNKIASRKQAKCPYCDIKACVKCTQTYLMNSHEDPHCMGCRKGWSREVLDSFALITWIDGEYKRHRQNILVDRERSRLPAAQLIIERIKEADQRRPYLDELIKEEVRIAKLYREASQKRYAEEAKIQLLSRGLLPDGTASSTGEKRQFVMPCPATACRGFLSTAYKCGVCDIYACPDCREIKGTNKDSDHTCDPNTVQTVAAMKKECRNCPECGTSIFKIVGCSQMFCTQCNTPFDWNTGKKVTSGAIHNPHYFDYIRQLNGGQMPRQPGDIPCGNNLPTPWALDRILRRIPDNLKLSDKRTYVYNGLMTFNHMTGWEIPRLTNGAEDTDNTTYNLKYLRNEMTELKWKQVLQQREKRRMRRDEVRQRMEAFCGAASDIYGRFMGAMNSRDSMRITPLIESGADKLLRLKSIEEKDVADLLELYTTLCKLREMMNAEFMKLSYRYRCQIMWITDTMQHEKKRAPRVKVAGEDSDDGSDDESNESKGGKKEKVAKKPKNTVVAT